MREKTRNKNQAEYGSSGRASYVVCNAFIPGTIEDSGYNDRVCFQRFCCKIEFAVIKKLDMDPSKADKTDTFEHFFIIHTFCVFVRIASARQF